jgi:hypothetical protein
MGTFYEKETNLESFLTLHPFLKPSKKLTFHFRKIRSTRNLHKNESVSHGSQHAYSRLQNCIWFSIIGNSGILFGWRGRRWGFLQYVANKRVNNYWKKLYVMPRRQPCPLQDGRRQGRHALMSRPDITTGNTDFTPTASLPTSRGRSARSALANLGWLATQSRNDLPRQLVLASHAIPFRLAALPRDDSGRLAALQPACWVPPPNI